MKGIREVASQDLQWVRLKWLKREFDLRGGDEVLARLYKEKGTGRIIGEAADGRWAFKRRSFWNAEIVVTDADSQIEVAVIRRGRNAGIGFVDGRFLMWNKTSFWRQEWNWVDSNGSPLVRFQNKNHVVLEPLSFSLPELPLLVIAGWHLILLQQEEAAATEASTVVISG